MKTILLKNNFLKIHLEEGIINVTWEVSSVDLETAQKLVEFRLNAAEGKAFPMIANIISLKHITKDARDFFASEEGCAGIKAAALLINSPLNSLIGNFWMRINKPLRPTKIFTEEGEAKKWLKQFL